MIVPGGFQDVRENVLRERPRVVFMDKRKLFIAAAAVVVLIAAIFVYFDSGLINRARQTGQEPQDTQNTAPVSESTAQQASGTGTGMQDTAVSQEQTLPEESEVLLNEEKVAVSNNTPEYDLDLKLCRSSSGKTFIRLQYYLGGVGTVNELDEGSLPELEGIFENREKEKGSTEAFKIGQALLNPVQSQLYLLVQGAPIGAYTQASMYMVKLEDMSVKKLFSYPGLYGKMSFNKDFSLLAYSFGDPPHLSSFQEANLLDVFDCVSGEYVIRASRTPSGEILGKNSSPAYLYDYEFAAWHSAGILKLRQAISLKTDVRSGITQTEVLYNIKQNLLLNLDGSEQKPETAGSGTAAASSGAIAAGGDSTGTGGAIHTGNGTGGNKEDSDPVKVLKSFYSYLGSEKDYSKAMELLDSGFKLRLGMLKQFGVEEISKSDIDADSASVYSQLLKAARFDSIKGEAVKDNICTITYYQVLGLSEDSQVRQPMSAQLGKSGKVWKIILIEDGTQ